MDIPLALKETALLDVFRDYHVPAGGRLSYADLRRDWSGTGLRSNDLDLTLHEMVGAGVLRRVHDDTGVSFELTGIGREMISEVPTARGLFAAARDAYLRHRLAGRPRGGMPARGRRQSDRPVAGGAY
ncbi:MAG TPA: hypothetical protein VFV27_08645 [Nevskiaceae bacterium]|nr:hypothetical protein [Nevskiaceae bacterium]